MAKFNGQYGDVSANSQALGEALTAAKLYAAIALVQQQAIAHAQQNQQVPFQPVSSHLLGLISDPNSPFGIGPLFQVQSLQAQIEAAPPSALTVPSVTSQPSSIPEPTPEPPVIEIPRSIQMASGLKVQPKPRIKSYGLFKFLVLIGLLAIGFWLTPTLWSLYKPVSSVPAQPKVSPSPSPPLPQKQQAPPISINDRLGELAAPVAPVDP